MSGRGSKQKAWTVSDKLTAVERIGNGETQAKVSLDLSKRNSHYFSNAIEMYVHVCQH